MQRILIAVTSCERQGKGGMFTGYELSEVSHPYLVFRDYGFEVDFISPDGGNPPIEKYVLSDPISRAFLEDEDAQQRIRNSRRPERVNADDYVALYCAGGHGAIWDFPDNQGLQALATDIYERGGVVAAVSFGLAGLVNVRLSDGSYLVEQKMLHSFAPEDPEAHEGAIPALLESHLRERGAIFRNPQPYAMPVEVCDRLISSQDPEASERVARVMVDLIQHQLSEPVLAQARPAGAFRQAS